MVSSRERTFECVPRIVALAGLSLQSLGRWIAEWGGMHKRLEIVVRNPGYESTEQAMGVLTLDFQGEVDFVQAIEGLHHALRRGKSASGLSIILTNERMEILGFNPEFYVSHRVSDATDWQAPWLLPAQGAAPPSRET